MSASLADIENLFKKQQDEVKALFAQQQSAIDKKFEKQDARVDALQSTVNQIGKSVERLERYQGVLYEEAMRQRVVNNFGVRFAKPFEITGLLGLARLVTEKARNEGDVAQQTANELRLINHIRAHIDEFTAALRAVSQSPSVEPAHTAMLAQFADNAARVAVSGNIDEFVEMCRKHHNMALALFCARYIKSRPLMEMELDCRGDVLFFTDAQTNKQTIVVRQLEFKRRDGAGGVSQAFEHLAAELAAISVIYDNVADARGQALVAVLGGGVPQRRAVSPEFDDKIQLCSVQELLAH
jgi:hypothetical protein